MIIQINNNLTDTAQKSYLSTSVNSGTPVLPVKNINAFTASWAVQVGETGEEQTEILLLGTATVAGTAGTATTNTVYSHPVNTPVYAIKYNQMIVKRSTSGTAGTATAVTDGTVAITPDSLYTQFEDTTGLPAYTYKVLYYNSPLASSSDESDWLLTTGYSQYSLAHMRNRVKGKLANTTEVSDDDVDDWINEWLENMNNAAVAVNEGYAQGTTSVSFSGTAQEGTITDSDFKYILKVEYGEDENSYIATKCDFQSIEPTDVYDSTHPFYYMRGENIIGRLPHDNTGTATITYYKMQTKLSDDIDELPNPLKGYSNSFVKWATAQARRRDNEYAVASELEISALNDLERFKQEISPRNKSGPTYIEICEDIGGDDFVY